MGAANPGFSAYGCKHLDTCRVQLSWTLPFLGHPGQDALCQLWKVSWPRSMCANCQGRFERLDMRCCKLKSAATQRMAGRGLPRLLGPRCTASGDVLA